MKNQAVMVISGYNIRAVVAFSRWATAHNINFHIIAKSEEDPIFLTDYKEYVAFTRDSSIFRPEYFRSWVEDLVQQYGYKRILILPSTEYLNRFLLKYRNSIETEHCIIPLVDGCLYQTISDKLSFAKLCLSYGLDIPKEYNHIPECFPFVAKPRTYFSTQGSQLRPQLIYDKYDLEKFCSEEETSDYFYQQFVYGRSLYLLAYISQRGVDDILFSQENLMQQARGGSIVLAKQSNFHHDGVVKRYVNMLRDQKFFGLIMVEVRLNESNGKFYMIEANPRLWGPMQFLIDNNIDLFGAMLRDYGFEISKPHTLPHLTTHYFWSGGLLQESQPITYHSYSSDEFVEQFHSLRPLDILFRKDTLNLFLKESEMEESDE